MTVYEFLRKNMLSNKNCLIEQASGRYWLGEVGKIPVKYDNCIITEQVEQGSIIYLTVSEAIA
ncbi:MAG: hypothetical protein NC131_01225 [Roseburia sp.]|nr:hypothetical protein [Roseburia sp.]